MMKQQEIKNRFIELRATGKSYAVISKELKISKSTCSAWEKELQNQISFLKTEQLKELYNNYFMTKQARIKTLGETLKKINENIEKIDFSNISPDKLLDYQLKYMETLKDEYIAPSININALDHPENVVESIKELYKRAKNGEAEKEQINKEILILNNLLKAYDTLELKKQLDLIQGIIEGR